MNPSRRLRGHTLIEVLFASFLVTFCAFIFAASVPTANTSREKADNRVIAASLAQKQMEAVRNLGYANVTVNQLAANGLLDNVTPNPAGSTRYTWHNTDAANRDEVSRVLPQGQAFLTIEQIALDLRRVTVEIRWRERTQTRSYTVGTLVANL